MQYRTLGRTQLRVSEIGYGGGRVRPDQDEQTSYPYASSRL